MGQTFSAKFKQLSPERRARITFGVDKMHRQYVASNGGVSKMPYDAAEFLEDEATIEAYLWIVQREAAPDEYVQALAVAERARRRLAGVERNGVLPRESQTEHNGLSRPQAEPRNWFRRLLPRRFPTSPAHPAANAGAKATEEPGLKSAAGAEEGIDTDG